ncbi:MAG TPA: ATP-binding protein [Terrimicrobiaceae bacterium]|nr:ATP-binding protein [Terrimicrobiaceae bacterium]
MSTTAQMTDSGAVMDLLRRVPLFANLQEEDKVCIEETEERQLAPGEMLFREGEQAKQFFVLLEGEISVSKKDDVVARNRPGAFFGEIPLLLGTPYMLSARAECDCRLIVFPEEAFWKLLRLCPAISAEIFRAMVTRLRNIEGSARQQEKLEALGTMSAGLAHELNNPSAAAQRIAVHLGEVIQTIQSVAHRLHHMLEHDHWDRLIALMDGVLEDFSAGKHHHSIEQSDSEDALSAWLREAGLTDAWKIAPVLVGAGLSMNELISLRGDLPKNAFGDAVRWIALRITIQTLLDDAEQCTGRIAGLVDAVRSSARQERAETADIDVHQQIRSALGVLERKLRNLHVTQNFSRECGQVRGYPSELAQVWVNLLDNAADAVNGGGEISIRTRRDDNQTVVEIIDNGPGVPPQNLTHIFEPFFTTKGVGSGKGLGLTISQGIVGDRHGGEIEVESKAGETRFIVRLPVRPIERNDGPEAIAASRAYMAELAEQLEERESRPPPATPPVSDGAFATVFDVPLFAQLDDSQRACFSTGTEIRLKAGETLLHDGDPADAFYVMLEGELRATKDFGGQEIFLGEVVPGEFFGEIEILLEIPNWVLIRVVADSRLFRQPRAGLWDLLRNSPQVAREIMRTLATRMRNLEGYRQEREKLIQLGAMAAGLAHELNNPATAARRAAADLRQSVEKVQDFACELNESLSVEQWQQLVATFQQAAHCAASQPKLNPLEQSDREEATECWLDSQNIADAWELAPALVNARVDQEELETLQRTVPPQDLENAIHWLAANVTTRDLLKSITHSTERISELVRAVKSYSFMDQAPWQEIDVHEGIENTLIILSHKLRNVTVTRDFDRTLPRLCAYGGELNQVWTNLIDNAIYAVGGTGRIDIRTRRDGEFFLVEIADNGGGIPPEAQPHIFFVPFFTTKGGSGTGLGLVISHRIITERHHGKIDYGTGPNGTQFNVRLPFESSENL